ncbi:MAG: hypothetical protein HOK28_11425 [Deltaproteobacteria bacterium]|nr:hypothetical protein [Deltaproteobacteria bacterium]
MGPQSRRSGADGSNLDAHGLSSEDASRANATAPAENRVIIPGLAPATTAPLAMVMPVMPPPPGTARPL